MIDLLSPAGGETSEVSSPRRVPVLGPLSPGERAEPDHEDRLPCRCRVNLTDRADLAVGADDDAVVEGLEGLVTIV